MLSKQDKGDVRLFLQLVTGYSRAQIDRHIRTQRVSGTMPLGAAETKAQPVIETIAESASIEVSALAPVPIFPFWRVMTVMGLVVACGAVAGIVMTRNMPASLERVPAHDAAATESIPAKPDAEMRHELESEISTLCERWIDEKLRDEQADERDVQLLRLCQTTLLRQNQDRMRRVLQILQSDLPDPTP